MRRFFVPSVLLICLAALSRAGETAAPAGAQAPVLRVMAFNIRYGTAADGDNHWNLRKDLVVETIRRFDPDILGTQEVLHFQAQFLREKLPEYDFVGVGRDDGAEKGEYAAIYFKRARFQKIREGHFWLSQTPDVPGSISWDSSLTRLCSWATLRLQEPPGIEVHCFNTHFDHRGAAARHESAKLMRSRIDALGPGAAVIVIGDFNAGADSPPYTALVAKEPPLLDTFRAAGPAARPEEGTFHGFSGKPGAARIDWILAGGAFEVLSAEVDRFHRDGRYPSDHFPVTAVLRVSVSDAAKIKPGN